MTAAAASGVRWTSASYTRQRKYYRVSICGVIANVVRIAKHRSDASFALGYLHGQERFFQMDLLRRNSAGELSELFGAIALPHDKKVRAHQFRQRANRFIKQLSPRQTAALKAYTNGVNQGIGDLGTIAYFQFVWTDSGWSTMAIMMLAIMNGLLTSIALETVILLKQLPFQDALRTAMGMSLISMIAMEAAMNITDVILTGGAMLTLQVIIPMWIAGFLTPWPYNYWRLKKYGIACH